MAIVTMKNLLEAGVHFGHQVKRWNPKMKKFIYASRNNIHIINLQQTIHYIKDAFDAVRATILAGKGVLFVGTKNHARDIIREGAEKCGMYHITHHWMGGLLTNFHTIKKTIAHLKKLEKMQADGTLEQLTKKEHSQHLKEIERLNKRFGGIKNMTEIPGIIFISDVRIEATAVSESHKLNIPIVGVVDTNSDPTHITHPIPGNDDAIKAISLYVNIISRAVIEADKEIGLEIVATEEDFKEQLENTENDPNRSSYTSYDVEDYSNYKAHDDKEISVESSEEEEIARKSGIEEDTLYQY